MWAALVFTTYVFISVSRSIRARVEEDDSLVSVDTRAIAGKLRWFPLVFALVGCPLADCRCIYHSLRIAVGAASMPCSLPSFVASAGRGLRVHCWVMTCVHSCVLPQLCTPASVNRVYMTITGDSVRIPDDMSCLPFLDDSRLP